MKSDRQIQKDVMEQLRFDPAIKSEKIGVSAEDGVVTLSGTVPTFAEKYLAEKRALYVSGVNAVVTDIHIELPEHLVKSDLDIAKSLGETFEWHVRIPPTVKASVSEGIVTLHGQVEWKYQQDAAHDAANQTKGVKGINDLITISQKTKSEDIKDLIEKALVRSVHGEAQGIEVQVTNEKVVLNGKVNSRIEADEAKWAAWAAPGVTHVENNLIIQ